MDIRDQLDSDWLKANINVKEGDEVRFLDGGAKQPPDPNGNVKVVFKVGILDASGDVIKEKKFQLNKSNLKEMMKSYGSETSKWVGKEMRINVIKQRNPQTNQFVDSIGLSLPNTDESGNVIVG